MKRVFPLLAGLVFLGTMVHAQDPAAIPVRGEDELVVGKGPFKETRARPGADLSRYSRLFLSKPVFRFRELDPAARTATTHSLLREDEGPFGVAEDSQERFAEVVEEAWAKELADAKTFEVVDTVGPGTLLVRGAVLDIVLEVPPDHPQRTRLYLSTVGEATIAFDLIDAETGVIQARFSERRRIQPFGTGQIDELTPPTTRATFWVDVERWARSAARDLRRELEKSQKT